MLNRRVPSNQALCAFDRAVDTLFGMQGGSEIPDKSPAERWAPLLEVARLLRAEGRRLRTGDPGSMARIWEDIRRRTDQQSSLPSSSSEQRTANNGHVWQRYCQSLVVGLCLGVVTILVNRLGGVPLYLVVSPSLGLALTSIGYEVSGREIEIRPISPLGTRRK